MRSQPFIALVPCKYFWCSPLLFAHSPGVAREVFFTTTSESQVYVKDPAEEEEDGAGEASDFACLRGLRVVDTVLEWAGSDEAAVSEEKAHDVL